MGDIKVPREWVYGWGLGSRRVRLLLYMGLMLWVGEFIVFVVLGDFFILQHKSSSMCSHVMRRIAATTHCTQCETDNHSENHGEKEIYQNHYL